MNRIQKILVLILILIMGISAVPGSAQDEGDGYKLYLPVLMRNYPYIPVFGVEVTSFGSIEKAIEADNHWLRYNGLLWSDVQPNNNTEKNWNSTIDAELQVAASNGMEVIIIIRSTPSWAQKYEGYYCGPVKPENLIDFSNFMASVVKKYSIPPYNVKYFEIWNEPDVDPYIHNTSKTSQYGCWGDNGDPYYGGGYYAEMLKVVYPKMKAANPSINVVLGGLLLDCDPRQIGTGYCPTKEKTNAPKFFEGVLRNDGGAYFDILSFHGYPTYQPNVNPIVSEIEFPSWSAAGGVVAGKLDYIKSIMSTYGIDKPIFHTEGALLLPKDSSLSTDEFEQAKANYLPWLYARNWSKGVQSTNWYTLNGPGWRQSALLDVNQNPRPAYDAYKLMIEKLGRAEFVSYNVLENGVYRFEFLTQDLRIWLLFSPDNNSRSVTTPAKFIIAYDVVNNPVTPVDGQITFSRPIYIEMSK